MSNHFWGSGASTFYNHFLLFAELHIRYIKLTSIDCTFDISSPNPMFDQLLESSHRDDSNKWSNIGFDKEIGIFEIKICSSSGVLSLIESTISRGQIMTEDDRNKKSL